MTNQTIQRYKNQYVVRSKADRRPYDTKKTLEKLAKLRDEVSKRWHGPHNAIREIRDQRGGAL